MTQGESAGFQVGTGRHAVAVIRGSGDIHTVDGADRRSGDAATSGEVVLMRPLHPDPECPPMRFPRAFAALLVLHGCTSVPQAPGPYTLEVAEAVPAITTPGDELRVAVRVIDANGTPIPGITVSWDGDGSVESVGGPTDADGIARGRWALPRWESFATINRGVGPSGRFVATASAPGMTSVRLETTARAFTADQVDAWGCALRSGELWCWAFNEGHEGIPTRIEVPAPRPLLGLQSSSNMRCLLDTQRFPWCGPRVGSLARVAGVPPLAAMQSPGVSGSLSFYCGLSVADGRPWCWPEDPTDPRAAWSPSDDPFASLSVGEDHACGLKTDGSAWCWGRNSVGQFGNGTTTDSDQPAPVAGGHRFVQLASGFQATCGMTTAHEIWCWGRGVWISSVVPIRIAITGIIGPGRLELGRLGDGYVLKGGAVHGWFGSVPLQGLRGPWTEVPVASIEADSWICLRSTTREVYCSWTMLERASADFSLQLELVAIPDPAAVAVP